jgi:hypothetical protein
MDLPTHSQAPAGTRIRLPLPRPDQLLCVRDLGDGRSMILPTKEKLDWAIAERPYRSVIVDAAGYVLSTGFAKFGNHTEASPPTPIGPWVARSPTAARFSSQTSWTASWRFAASSTGRDG